MLFPHHHVYKSHKNINTIKFHLLNTLGMSHAGQMSKWKGIVQSPLRLEQRGLQRPLRRRLLLPDASLLGLLALEAQHTWCLTDMLFQQKMATGSLFFSKNPHLRIVAYKPQSGIEPAPSSGVRSDTPTESSSQGSFFPLLPQSTNQIDWKLRNNFSTN